MVEETREKQTNKTFFASGRSFFGEFKYGLKSVWKGFLSGELLK